MALMNTMLSTCDMGNGTVITVGLQNPFSAGQNKFQLDVWDYSGNLLEQNTGTASTRIPSSFTSLIAQVNSLSMASTSTINTYALIANARIQKQGQYYFLSVVAAQDNNITNKWFRMNLQYFYSGSYHNYNNNNAFFFFHQIMGCAYYAPSVGGSPQNYFVKTNCYQMAAQTPFVDYYMPMVQNGLFTMIATTNNTYLSSGHCPKQNYVFNALTGEDLTLYTVVLDTVNNVATFNNCAIIAAAHKNNISDFGGACIYLDSYSSGSIFNQNDANPLFTSGGGTVGGTGPYQLQLSILNPFFALIPGIENMNIGAFYAFQYNIANFQNYVVNSNPINYNISVGICNALTIPLATTSSATVSNFLVGDVNSYQYFGLNDIVNITYNSTDYKLALGGNFANDEGNLQLANTPVGIIVQSITAFSANYRLEYFNNNGIYPGVVPPKGRNTAYVNNLVYIPEALNTIGIYGETFIDIAKFPSNIITLPQNVNNITIAGNLIQANYININSIDNNQSLIYNNS